MFKTYRSPTPDEIGLKQCAKCDCLILTDSSYSEKDKNTKLDKSTDPKQQISTDEESDGIVLLPKCNETVKIYVRSEQCDDCYTKRSPTLAEPKSRKASKTRLQEAGSSGKNPEPGKNEPVEVKKNSCFQICRKKKNKKVEMVEKHADHDTQTQTQEPTVNDVKMPSSDMNIGDIIKNCSNCGKPGGCNTNTIIFPRDKSSGDGFASLENWLRMEAKANSRNLEDILSELHKQRREMHELKDMLDTVVRGLREQLFMTAFGKGRNELFEDLKRQKNLERKTNTLSIAKSDEAQEPKITPGEAPKLLTLAPPEKTKKRSFPWCKSFI